MKILFAIQGTGNGHLSRARDVYPELAKHGDVDVLISGIQADVAVPFPVSYSRYGMSFIFGNTGGVDIFKTAKALRLPTLINDIRSLPVHDYDLVVNDFEPVSAWACRLRKVPCIGLSHQSAVLHPDAPKPLFGDWKGELILRRYAPVDVAYGFHFKPYGDNIFTPVIRKEVRDIEPVDLGHYTVYLPAYDDEKLIKNLSVFDTVQWKVFSKHNKQPFTFKNIDVRPIENNAFIESMATSTGVLCGAGFEGPAEALYLGKKLIVIPMIGQYEQQCNAAALEDIGVPVIKKLHAQYHNAITRWLESDERIVVNYPDQTEYIVSNLVATYAKTNVALAT